MPYERYGIPVDLGATNETVMMVTASKADKMVVFADPAKLQPYLDAINSREAALYLAGKRTSAVKGVMEARAATNERMPIPSTNENPLPMGQVNCRLSNGHPVISFNDGTTRTDVLIDLKAKFIPLEVDNAQAQLLHQTVGGDIPPKPVEHYQVPAKIQEEKFYASLDGVRNSHRPDTVIDDREYLEIAKKLRPPSTSLPSDPSLSTDHSSHTSTTASPTQTAPPEIHAPEVHTPEIHAPGSRLKGGGLIGAAVVGTVVTGAALLNGASSMEAALDGGKTLIDGAVPGVSGGFTNLTQNQSLLDTALNWADTATGTIATGAAATAAVTSPLALTGAGAAVPVTSAVVAGVAGLTNGAVGLISDGLTSAGLTDRGGLIHGVVDVAKAYSTGIEKQTATNSIHTPDVPASSGNPGRGAMRSVLAKQDADFARAVEPAAFSAPSKPLPAPGTQTASSKPPAIKPQ